MTKTFAIILLLLLCTKSSYSELFTALVELEELLHTEYAVITAIENYITAQEQKIVLLRRYVQAYTDQYKKASEDVQAYVENPINAYLLVKRLTRDWQLVQNLIDTNTGKEFIIDLDKLKGNLKFPSYEDLNGAAVALTRLQDTYQLDTPSLANGEINGVKYATELTAADCFELGRQSYNNADHYHAQLWMMEADERLKREVNQTVERSEILDYLTFSSYQLGDIGLALDLTNKLLELVPTHERILGNKMRLEGEIARNNLSQQRGEDESVPSIKNQTVNIPKDISSKRQARFPYEGLCRGQIRPSDAILAQLKCRYTDNGNPFLKIAPFKVEEMYLDPKILVFHDVMADDEIATIKALAQPRFKRAIVQNFTTGASEAVSYRISKTAWLDKTDHKHVADVVQRVEDMTGLTQKSAELLQVANYGIGGHYEPHYDFAKKGETTGFKSFGLGNRIATVLFYMSDVAQGGATAFIDIQVAVRPKKGTAVFWYNLHSSGDGDKRTVHAACPILTGSKWVSSEWIHEAGQHFRRPCDLERPPPEYTV